MTKNNIMAAYEDRIVRIANANRRKEKQVKLMPIASYGLCHVIGKNGIPIGHIIEIFGPFGSGKTTLANYIAKVSQEYFDKPSLLVDVEGKYDIDYAIDDCGLDPNLLHVAYPNSGEDACEVVEAAVMSDGYGAVILDSVGALVFEAVLEGKMTDRLVGIDALMISKFVKRLALRKRGKEVVIILINQIRAQIGMYGGGENTPGGYALKHLASIRIRVGKGKKIESKKEQIGFFLNSTGHKAFGPPYRKAEIPLIYGGGIDPNIELLLTCKELGIVQQRGASFKLGEISLGVGIVAAGKGIFKYKKRLKPKVLKGLREKAEKGIIIIE